MVGALRDELKFILRHEEKTVLLERWRRHLTGDRHANAAGVTPILSQYYDTPDLRFYEEKLDGVAFRNKVRLRTYGYRFETGGVAFLEIKQRHGDRVRKIRQKIKNFRPRDLEPECWTFDDPDHRSAFGMLLERYRLRPSAQVWYLREAFHGSVEPDVRVTFDSGVMGLHPGERLTWEAMSDPWLKLLPESLVICEVKATRAVPRWVVEGAPTVELVQRPVPKYVMAVERLQLQTAPPIYVLG